MQLFRISTISRMRERERENESNRDFCAKQNEK